MYHRSTHNSPRRISDPFAEPVDVQEAKDHCRIFGSDEDSLVADWVTTARNYVETETGRAMVTGAWRLTLDRFPWRTASRRDGIGAPIVIPCAPLQSVTSIAYVDASGNAQTLSASAYRVDVESEVGGARITPAFGTAWPITQVETGAVTVNFVAGYVTPFTAVAATDVATSLGRTFANGDVVRVFNSGGELPSGLSALTNYYVIGASGATFKLSLTLGGSALDIVDVGQGTHFIGNPSSPVSEDSGLRSAIKLLVGHWNENREAVLTGTISKDIEFAVESLIWQRRIFA